MTIRVLLIDANTGEAAKIAALLPKDSFETYDVKHAADIESAEDMIGDEAFDAVLIDESLSLVDELAGLRRLIVALLDVPIIVLTGTENESAGIGAVKAGAQDYLVKSRINGDVLRRVLRYSIDRVQFRIHVDGLSREVEDRQRIAEALSDSQYRMIAINESLYEAIIVFDENGHIALSNRAAAKLLSDSEKLPNNSMDSAFRLKQGEHVQRFITGPFRQVIREGKGLQDEDAVFLRSDGKALAVAYACSPLMEKDGIQGAVLSFRDISAYKQAQREALQASKLASVGQLAAGIAHEINTPIQYIGDNLGFLSEAFQALIRILKISEELIASQEGPAGEPARAKLAQAMRDADAEYLLENVPEATRQSLEGVAQVARIVLAMKEFSHPGEREMTEEDLNRAITNTLSVTRNEWKHWANLDVRLDDNLPRVRCLAGEINQVLLNLVVNAAQAIEEAKRGASGKIMVATRQDGDFAEIIVEDNGIGMTEAVRLQIFDPFFTTKKIGKGTGQGLAICRDVVVAKHGGTIAVDSTPGVGTRFTVRLPIGQHHHDTEAYA